MDTRRLLLAAALSFGFLLVWHYFFPAEPPVPSTPPAVERAGEAAGSVSGSVASSVATTPETTAAAPAPAAATPVAESIRGEREERIELALPGAKAVFSNRGGALVSFTQGAHRGADGQPLELVRSRPDGTLPYSVVGQDGAKTPLTDALFAVRRLEGSEGEGVEFRFAEGTIEATKTFRARPNGMFDVAVSVRGLRGWALVVGPGIRNLSAAELDSKFERRAGVYLVSGSSVEVLAPEKASEVVSVPAAGLSWVGLDDSYFLAAVIPGEGLAQAVFRPVLLTPGAEGISSAPVPAELTSEQKKLKRDFVIYLVPQGETLALSSFWGAKERDVLAALPNGLDKALRLGMFWWLALPLLASLHWIYEHVVANYGWAIVLLTTAIKLLLLPLTHSSTKSMKKMQELNPKLQALRERYRSKLRDKNGRPNLEMQRKMNEEMMAIYKAEGASPAGGCLPMLLQMPVFFAFYNVLYSAVELRNAPWLLWIHDLAARDPYYVLPLVMGATQFLQVRMTPTAGDPMQRRMFQLMPILMTFLFLGFPSGLVLYWLTNNVLTIIQQAVYNRWITPTPAAAANSPVKAK